MEIPHPRIIIYLFFILAFLERTLFNLGPNVELVTLTMLAASAYLSSKTTFKLIFLLMAATDLIIGNTSIFLFTWSGFLLPLLVLPRLLRRPPFIFKATSLGVLSNLFFYLWTNFGVWLLDSWGMYTNDLPGLIKSLVMGLPFLKLQLASTFLFVPLGFSLINLSHLFIYKLDSFQKHPKIKAYP